MNTHSIRLPLAVHARIRAARDWRLLFALAVLGVALGAIFLALLAGALWLDWRWAWSTPTARWAGPGLTLGVLLAASVAMVRWLRLTMPLSRAAREIDRANPGLQERLSTVFELCGQPLTARSGGSPELLARVAYEATVLAPQVRRTALVRLKDLRRPALAFIAAAVGFACLCGAVRGNLGPLLRRFALPWQTIPLTRLEFGAVPARVARGQPLDLQATIAGRLPPRATLLVRDASGVTRESPLALQRTGAIAHAQHRIVAVEEALSYRIVAGDAASGWVEVQVVERPRIGPLALRIVPPAYTKRPTAAWDTLPQSARALRGSRLTLEFTVDQPLTTAALEVAAHPAPRRLPLEAAGPSRYRWTRTLDDALQFSLVLENELGQRAPAGACEIVVEEDQPPVVRLLETSEKVALSTKDVLRVDFQARDDFGVAEAELVVTTRLPGQAPRETVIPIPLGAEAGQTRVQKSVQLDLAALQIEPQTEVSYTIRARDQRGTVSSADGKAPAREEKPSPPQPAEKPEQHSPNNPLSKRTLDLAGQSSSEPRKIHIEQTIGKFQGEAAEKQSVAIDEALKSLRSLTASALLSTDAAGRGLAAGQPLSRPGQFMAIKAQQRLQSAAQIAAQLKAASAGTPYTFFGSQVEAIVARGLAPASARLHTAITARAAAPELEAATLALRWTLETLDTLTQQWTTLREVQKTEQLAERIKEMHVFFAEGMPKWLQADSGAAAYERSMMEVPINDEYRRQYEEFLRQRREAYEQLGELLENDPRLQARFLEQQKKKATPYREVLLALQKEQAALEALAAATSLTRGAERAGAAEWQAMSQHFLKTTAALAAQAATAATTWMPENFPEKFRRPLAQAVQSLALAAQAAAADSGSAALPKTAEALRSLAAAERALTALRQSPEIPGVDRGAFLSHRAEDFDRLHRALDRNDRFLLCWGKGDHAGALLAAQAALNDESSHTVDEVRTAITAFTTVTPEVDDSIRILDRVLLENVARPQTRARAELVRRELPAARRQQALAAGGFGTAVGVLDALIRRALRKLDEEVIEKPVVPGSPKLDALVKALETEERSARSFGFACRQANIQVVEDWERKPSPDSAPPPPPSQMGQSNPQGQSQEGRAARQRALEERMEQSKQSAQATARKMAEAQRVVDPHAAEAGGHGRPAPAGDPAALARAKPPVREDWNKLPSVLDDHLKQERAPTPPKRYEEAIREYFKAIAEKE